MLIVVGMVPEVIAGQTLEIPWLALQVDSTNIIGLVGVTIIFFLTSIYNIKAEQGGRLKPSLYNFFVLLFLFCMVGILLSFDLFGIFLFVELLIGVSIILVTHSSGKLSPEAAFKYLVITAVSALFVLLGTLIVFVTTQDSNMFSIMENPGALVENARLLMIIVALFVAGIGADIGVVPFHGWLPDAFPASTPTINGFFCAEPIALIFVLYRVVNMFYVIYPSIVIILVMVGVGLGSIIIGTLLAYSQKDFMRMIAYASIDTFGYAILIFGLFTSLSSIAGKFYIVNAALIKTGVILCLGSVYIRAGTRNMDVLGGLAGKMKKTAIIYIVCILSLVGVPPLSGFFGKWLIFTALYDYLLPQTGVLISVLVIVFFAGLSIIPFMFLIRSFNKIFLGHSTLIDKVNEVPFSMWLPVAVLVGLTILVGLFPQIFLGLISPV
ncbi:MAG: proton-conducting transporter membrane subunit [Candidatus Bathyarchaeota archaeon]|nr:proton-conducting transporter membrane subunit [Candidatus Bathyarchaeum tardum]